jgi:hypothetical protein
LYFREYFDALSAKTIVVERHYIDRDYLEDFAGHYVRCFANYEKTCTRLHFFASSFDEEMFVRVLLGQNDAKVLGQYLGFVVLKPLPRTIVGRTCLATYGSEEGRRHYPVLREYTAHLFGLPLAIHTLAFQEQDQDVAACATSALWSVFQGTAKLFQHDLPTPLEITQAATISEPSQSRNIPAVGGLPPTQIARAIRSVGLEPLFVSPRNDAVLKSTVYAYLCGNIPMILGAALFDGPAGKDQMFRGKHAVAVTGFSLGLDAAVPESETGFLLKASRIDKIYVHDDQVGPFARMAFDGVVERFLLRAGAAPLPNWSLSTSWRRSDGSLGMRAVPDMLMVPLYHKIRIPYELIENVIRRFDAILTEELGAPVLADRLVWDIRLCTGSDLKHSVRTNNQLNQESLTRFLAEPLPRFVWRAAASNSKGDILEAIFDATDIGQGKLLLQVLEYNQSFCGSIRAVAKNPDVRAECFGDPAEHLLTWMAR